MHAAEIVLEGSFQGKNLYVLNPFDRNGESFCITEVLVNEVPTKDEIHSSSFEIDLIALSFKQGEKVFVKIRHVDGCLPKVLNPEALKPRASFETATIKADEKNLKFVTRNEGGALLFTVEEFRWNNWRKIGEFMGKGVPELTEYNQPINIHVGLNKFRVSQTDYTNKPKYSSIAQFRTNINVPEVTMKLDKGVVKFSVETVYEIYDGFANKVKSGVGNQVDISDLAKGAYHVYYDDKTGEIVKNK